MFHPCEHSDAKGDLNTLYSHDVRHGPWAVRQTSRGQVLPGKQQ